MKRTLTPKVLFLGAAPHQCPAIRYARDSGCTIITCDNIPTNPGHALAHESRTLSVVDHPAVLQLARNLRVDAVIGFASEPCSLAAARVCDRLGLPGCGQAAASLLAEKDRFRQRMRDSGIQDLPFATFNENERREARQWACQAGHEIVIKPVDGSGSKGVSIRPQPHELEAAFDYALASSPSRRFIVESFVPRIGRQVGGDGFFEDGRLVFVCFGESFPILGLSQPDILSKLFPCSHDAASLDQLRDLIERSGRAAGLHSGPVNFDALIRPDGTPFLIEMAARNGGNYLCHMIARQTGVDLMAAAVEIALDEDWKLPSAPAVEPRWHASWVLYSRKSGVLRSVDLDSDIAPHVVEFHPHAMPGAEVSSFTKAGDSLGVVILRFDSLRQMDEMMPQMSRWCRVKMEGDA